MHKVGWVHSLERLILTCPLLGCIVLTCQVDIQKLGLSLMTQSLDMCRDVQLSCPIPAGQVRHDGCIPSLHPYIYIYIYIYIYMKDILAPYHP
jgi:hypothetical protein